MPQWQKGKTMLLRLSNVKLSIFNPETKKWISMSDMTVLLREDFIYYVKSKPFYDAVMKELKDNDDYQTAKIEANKQKIFKGCFRELLDTCPITDELQGEIYSGNVLWKVEREENPSRKPNETTEIIDAAVETD